jgi:hypothetical protein
MPVGVKAWRRSADDPLAECAGIADLLTAHRLAALSAETMNTITSAVAIISLSRGHHSSPGAMPVWMLSSRADWSKSGA